MTELEKYYNKFNEEKRLTRRHGYVEYVTTMKYIHDYLDTNKNSKILEVGAGTGRYSVALAEEGYNVTAIEPVKYNLGILKSKKSSVKAYQGNALKLSRFENESFDMTLLLGPMYHLCRFEDKVKALKEAMRVTKRDGIIMVAYCMNEYSILTYGFKENNILRCMEEESINQQFHCVPKEDDLYDYIRLEDIDKINEAAQIQRIKIISADGPANYMRQILNKMDEDTYNRFIEYHLVTCERRDLIGAGAHTLDILRNSQ